jgi:putative ABC transport system substrate-binding protein
MSGRLGVLKRRTFVLAVGGGLGVSLTASPALGQAPTAPRHVAVLTVSNVAAFAASLQGLRDGLRERGHVEGRDVVLDVRHAAGLQELPRLAVELAALRPALFIATGAPATNAALAASAELPVVSIGDLVAAGHAAQLNRPGGRVTGISLLLGPLNAKRLELMASLLPHGSVVLNLGDPNSVVSMAPVEAAGRSLGLVLHAAFASTPAEIDAAFARARHLRAAGLNVLNSPFLSGQHARIIEQAAASRLPAIYQWPEAAFDGGLMGYGPSLAEMFRQVAGYVSRILGGALAADMPIEQPTRFDLIINLKTAKMLGLQIPRSLLLRADKLIE